MDANGLDEHKDAGRFLIAFDALCDQADIPDALVVHHMGHSGERSRGDSRLRDWPDVEWRLVRANEDPSSPRFVSAFGRDVDIPEGEINYNPDTRHVRFVGGSRTQSAARQTIPDIISLLQAENEPISKLAAAGRLQNTTEYTRTQIRQGIEIAIHQGTIQAEVGAHGAHLLTISTPAGRSSPQLAGQLPVSSPGVLKPGELTNHLETIPTDELPNPFDDPQQDW